MQIRVIVLRVNPVAGLRFFTQRIMRRHGVASKQRVTPALIRSVTAPEHLLHDFHMVAIQQTGRMGEDIIDRTVPPPPALAAQSCGLAVLAEQLGTGQDGNQLFMPESDDEGSLTA